MNFTIQLRLLNARGKAEIMFKDMGWFLGTDVEINTKTNELFILVSIDRHAPEAPQLLNTMPKFKIDRIPLKPVLKDR